MGVRFVYYFYGEDILSEKEKVKKIVWWVI